MSLPWVGRLWIKITNFGRNLGLILRNRHCRDYFFKAMATETNSEIEEIMHIIQVTNAADSGNEPQASPCSGGFSMSVISGLCG